MNPNNFNFPVKRSLSTVRCLFDKALMVTMGLSVLLAVPVCAQAAGPTEIDRIRNQNENEQRQRAIEQELQKQTPKTEVLVPQDTKAPATGGKKFSISTIVIDEGDYHVAGAEKITRRYENTAMGGGEIFKMLKELNRFYYENGYVTTLATVGAQNLSAGVLTVKIDWGRTKGWLLNGQALTDTRDRLMILSAWPGGSNGVLNVRDVDQAIENLNTIGQSARIDIVSADEPGYSNLDVKMVRTQPFAITASIDNSGNSDRINKGELRYGLDLAAANILALNDMLTVSGSGHYYDDASHNRYDTYSAGYGVRLGNWTADINARTSPTKRLINGFYGDYLSRSRTQNFNLKLSRMLTRSQTGKLSVYGAADRTRTENYIDDYLITNSSNIRSTLTLGLDSTTQWNSGILVSSLGWTQGVGMFGATEDPNSTTSGPTSRYNKFNLRMNWSRDVQIAGHAFNYGMGIGAQYSANPLFYDAKFTVGDQYTVRGFKLNSAYGDSGAYISNTLNAPMQTKLGQFTPFIGLDAGTVYNREDDSPDGSMVGVVTGLRWSNQYTNMSLAVGKPLRSIPGQGYATAVYARTAVTF